MRPFQFVLMAFVLSLLSPGAILLRNPGRPALTAPSVGRTMNMVLASR